MHEDLLPRTPSAAVCRKVVQALGALHGHPERHVAHAVTKDAEVCGARHEVLAAVIATILSQHTTAKNARAAMDTLWDAFAGDYAAMHRAGAAAVARAIRVGGLSNVKAARLCALLADVKQSCGHYSLEHLHRLDDAAAKAALRQFAGVGPKTASCVLLFALHRSDFAVDTHVLRISKRLGWVAANASREQAYVHLDKRVPDALKYALHVLLVHHGKCCPECAANGHAQRPAEGPCPLTPLLPKRQLRAPRAARTARISQAARA